MDAPFTWFSIKNASYILAYIFASTYLGFEPSSLAILISLMLTDVATGVIRSFVVNGGSSITSSVGIRGLLAKILTITAIFSFALAAKGVGFNVGSTIQGVVMVFTLAETYSIIGNVNSAITGKAKVEFDAVAYMLQKVKDLLDSLTTK